MNAKKKTLNFKSIAMILVALIAIGGVFLYLNFSNILTSTAEKVASNALGVNVAIGSIDLSLSDKSIEVRNIKIDNPSGFSGDFLDVDLVRIAAGEISKTKLVFKEVIVEGTDVVMQVKKNGDSNIAALKNGIKTSDKKEAQNAGEPIKVIIQDFQLNEASLYPKIAMLEKSVESVTMPNIRLRNIGEKQNGIVAREAILQIVNKISDVAVKQAAKSGVLDGVAKDKLQELGVSSSLIQNIGSDADKAAKDIGNAVKSLF